MLRTIAAIGILGSTAQHRTATGSNAPTLGQNLQNKTIIKEHKKPPAEKGNCNHTFRFHMVSYMAPWSCMGHGQSGSPSVLSRASNRMQLNIFDLDQWKLGELSHRNRDLSIVRGSYPMRLILFTEKGNFCRKHGHLSYQTCDLSWFIQQNVDWSNKNRSCLPSKGGFQQYKKGIPPPKNAQNVKLIQQNWALN